MLVFLNILNKRSVPCLAIDSERLFTYNAGMDKSTQEEVLKTRISAIAGFYRREGRMPSFSEIGELLGLRSKNAVSKLIDRLEELRALKRDPTGKLIPLSIAYPVKVLGTVEAGFPSPAEEELTDTLSLDDLLIKNREATFLLKVSGDSMRDAGILPGDMVIVERGLEPRNGDIVIAEVDGKWTMKYFEKKGESVTLLPANPKYKPIKPKSELKVAGVVTSVIRKYK